jgi:hypothetical protein
MWRISVMAGCLALALLVPDDRILAARRGQSASSTQASGEYVLQSLLGVQVSVTGTTRPVPANSGAEALIGFDVRVTYEEPGTSDLREWVKRDFLPIVPGTVRSYGPFGNRRGNGFRIDVRVSGGTAGPVVFATLACDNLAAENRYVDGLKSPPFKIILGPIPDPVVKLGKDLFEVYGYVSFAFDLAKLVSGAMAPEAFAVTILVSEAEDQVVKFIPDNYEGMVGYRCNYCNKVTMVAPVDGCREFECPHCRSARARICRIR